MGILHLSQFTAANGTNVGTLTPAVGNTLVNDGGGSSTVQDNRAFTSNVFSRYRTNQTLGTADYQIRAVARRIAATSDKEELGLQARFTAGAADAITVKASKTAIQMFKVVSGVETTVSSAYTWSPSTAVDYTLDLLVVGTSASVKLDGVEIISPQTITDVTAEANAAWYLFGPDSNATRGWHLDTFEVSDFAAPSIFFPYYGRFGF